MRLDFPYATLHPCVLHAHPTELEAHLQISDKAVAEFVIDTARDCKDVDAFKKASTLPCAFWGRPLINAERVVHFVTSCSFRLQVSH
jgi:hypothetical protein